MALTKVGFKTKFGLQREEEKCEGKKGEEEEEKEKKKKKRKRKRSSSKQKGMELHGLLML